MIYKYQRVATEGPNGTTYYFKHVEGSVDLAEIDGWWYVYVPDSETLYGQHAEISLSEVTLTEELRNQIKASSRSCQLINEWMQDKIREKYSLEDEQYFARIGVGVALGVYQFQPGEQEALLEFGNFVESVRQWGRAERSKIGL